MTKEGKKFDNGKLPMHLIPTDVMEDLVEVLAYGAAKYGANNWQTLDNAEERYYDALVRHLNKHQQGELVDSESGLKHISHVLANAVFLNWFFKEDILGVAHSPIQQTLKYKLEHYAFNPTRGTDEASGIDVYSPAEYVIHPYTDVLIPTGVSFDIPKGYDLSLYNKSGVATKQKLIKGAELIDVDYTGEVHVHLFNFSDKDVCITRGFKIAQFVLRPVLILPLEEVQAIKKVTARNNKAFGSTGVIHESI